MNKWYSYLPEANTLTGFLFYSFIGYLIVILCGYLFSYQGMTREEYRRRYVSDREKREEKEKMKKLKRKKDD